QIRFSEHPVKTHRDDLDGIIALNSETIDLHIERLHENGFIIADEDVPHHDPRLITIPAKKLAKEVGNPKVQSSAILGALMKIYGMDLSFVEDIFAHKFNDVVVQQNMAAFQKGYELTEARF